MRTLCRCGQRNVIRYATKDGMKDSQFCHRCAKELRGTRPIGAPRTTDSPICTQCNKRHVDYHRTRAGEKVYALLCYRCKKDNFKLYGPPARRSQQKKYITVDSVSERPMCVCGKHPVGIGYSSNQQVYKHRCYKCERGHIVNNIGTVYRPVCACGRERITFRRHADHTRTYLDICQQCISEGKEPKAFKPVYKCVGCKGQVTEVDKECPTLCSACINLRNTERRGFPGIPGLPCTKCSKTAMSTTIDGKRYYRDVCRTHYIRPPKRKLGRPKKTEESHFSSGREGNVIHILWPKDIPSSTGTLICPHRYNFIQRFQQDYGIKVIPDDVMQYSSEELEQLLRKGFEKFYAESNDCPSSFTFFFSVADRETFAKCFPFRPLRLQQLWRTVLNHNEVRIFINSLSKARHAKIVTPVDVYPQAKQKAPGF